MKLLLFSGGIESTCLAHLFRPDLLLTIDYGQKSAEGEIRASAFIAKKLDLKHEVLTAHISSLGAGDLAGLPPARKGPATEFWPFRNQHLITLAAMRCAQENFQEILIGTISTDSVHEDGTIAFINNMNALLKCQKKDLAIAAPAIDMDSLTLIKASSTSKDLLGWSFSCYRGPIACGQCRGCMKTIELMKLI